jgi:GNAT superfamily N-acetyltransferase
VRPAVADDAGALAAVNVASWRAAYAGIMPDAYLDALSVEQRTASWARAIANPALRCLVAETHDGRVVGYATVGPDPEDDGPHGMLLMMYTLPDQWGGGAGPALMAASREALRGMCYAEAALWVLEANARARRFYERDGWREDGARRDDDYGGVTLSALRYRTAV